MTNYEKIKNMTIEEMADYFENVLFNEEVCEIRRCQDCMHCGTHHTNKSYLGTEYEHLYECKNCEYENDKTFITWLNKEVEN